MFKFEKFLPKKKSPERFAKTPNPIDDKVDETIEYWKKVERNGLPETSKKESHNDIEKAA